MESDGWSSSLRPSSMNGAGAGLVISGEAFTNTVSFANPSLTAGGAGSSRARAKYLLDELIQKKRATSEKLLREKQRHNRVGLATPHSSVVLDGRPGSIVSNSVEGDFSLISPRHGGSVSSMSKGIVSTSRYSTAKITVNTGYQTAAFEDQNMSLFTPKSHIYVKKNAPSPFIYTLENTVPVVFPHYERKKVVRESHTKAFKEKIAEVMLQSQAYGKIERPYLFSLLKQSGGKSSAYLSGKTSTEIIEEAYRKAEQERQLQLEEQDMFMSRAPSLKNISTGDNLSDTDGEGLAPIHNIKIEPADDIFKYVPKKKVGSSTSKVLASVKNKKHATAVPMILRKEPPAPAIKLEVMTDEALEELLSAVDRERLNYHLNRQVALARSGNQK